MSELHLRHLANVAGVHFFGRNTVRLEADRRRTFHVNNPVRLADHCLSAGITMIGSFVPVMPTVDYVDGIAAPSLDDIAPLDDLLAASDDAYEQALHDDIAIWMDKLGVVMVDALRLAGLKVSGTKLEKAKRLAYHNVAVPTYSL